MGNNATLVVLTDAIHQIGEDKDFGRHVKDAVLMQGFTRGARYVPAGGHANAAVLVDVHDSCAYVPILVGENTGFPLKVVVDPLDVVMPTAGPGVGDLETAQANALLYKLAYKLGAVVKARCQSTKRERAEHDELARRSRGKSAT
jgi:hypothetical protein